MRANNLRLKGSGEEVRQRRDAREGKAEERGFKMEVVVAMRCY